MEINLLLLILGLIANFDSQILKDVLGKYINLRDAKKNLKL